MIQNSEVKYLDRYIGLNPTTIDIDDLGKGLDILVVIPAYKETFEDIDETIRSLVAAQQNYRGRAAVLLLLNYKDSDHTSIKLDAHNARKSLESTVYGILCLFATRELTGKKAGVGMARKILMDAALHYFYREDRDGIIVNLDADTSVSSAYFDAIDGFFASHDALDAASIHFEHRIPEPDDPQYAAIIQYELHLRYFVNMQRWMALPYAYQTVGSAMACRAYAYAKMGGMPQRQAGEDFYFIHKFTDTQKLGEIRTACVYPSPRPSDRVPFGTGKAVADMLKDSKADLKSYNPKSFMIIDRWIDFVLSGYPNGALMSGLPDEENGFKIMAGYLRHIKAEDMLREIRAHTASTAMFRKRFFQWFDAFQLMKCLHYLRDNGLADKPLDYCLEDLFRRLDLHLPKGQLQILLSLRSFDRSIDYQSQWSDGFISRESRISASFSTHQDSRE